MGNRGPFLCFCFSVEKNVQIIGSIICILLKDLYTCNLCIAVESMETKGKHAVIKKEFENIIIK